MQRWNANGIYPLEERESTFTIIIFALHEIDGLVQDHCISNALAVEIH